MSQSASNMEVDPPSSTSGQGSQGGGTLKRSNSAPMINMLVAASQSVEVSPTSSSFKTADAGRLRRLSSSNMGIHQASSSGQLPLPKGADRVNQIKHEENNITDRETAREKEVHCSWQVTNSWDVLSLNTHPDAMMTEPQRRPRSFSESLHIMTTSNLLCGSPSPPTRVVKQCFSPSMRVPVKNTTFTPSPSPSPTRKNFIRSLSPIATQTPLKRKWEPDGGDRYDYLSPPKKFHTGPGTPERNLPHPLAHSISSSSLEEGSPEQTVPRSCLPAQPHPHPHPPAPALALAHSHPQLHHNHTHPHPHKEPAAVAFMPMEDIHMADSSEHGQAGGGGGFTPIHPDRL